MKPVRVQLKDRAYDIHFGPLAAIFPKRLQELNLSPSRIVVIAPKSLERLGYPSVLERALRKSGYAVVRLPIADGEQNKNLDTVEKLFKSALKHGVDRRSVVVAMGGGVVTDMAGFFAATFMRGVPYVSIPTTLLGMVDAAIGGKTGVDLDEGKNLIGAFWQPRMVLCDLAILETLPPREWRTGLAEIIKYGVIIDKSLFGSLEARIQAQPRMDRWPVKDIAEAVLSSVKAKAAVVASDEKETPLKGGREILNFGHTAGHALEAATGYGRFSHGEAISVGMIVAGFIALARGLWSPQEQTRLASLLSRAGLPTGFPPLSAAEKRRFWESLNKDKKHISGNLRFVLPEHLGKVRVVSGISPEEIKAAALAAGLK